MSEPKRMSDARLDEIDAHITRNSFGDEVTTVLVKVRNRIMQERIVGWGGSEALFDWEAAADTIARVCTQINDVACKVEEICIERDRLAAAKASAESKLDSAHTALRYAIGSPCWACNADCEGPDLCADNPHILACPRNVYRHAIRAALEE